MRTSYKEAREQVKQIATEYVRDYDAAKTELEINEIACYAVNRIYRLAESVMDLPDKFIAQDKLFKVFYRTARNC